MVFYPFENWSDWKVGDDFSRFSDAEIMKKAFEIAAQRVGRTNPNPAVGAIIIAEGKILAWGGTQEAGGNHAEIEAINMAREMAPHKLQNSTIYVTLEPCAHFGKTPPCARALVEAKVSRVVISALDQNPLVAGKGIEILKENGVEVLQGVASRLGDEFYETFFYWMKNRLPWVIVKTACALDGGMNIEIDGGVSSVAITSKETNTTMSLIRRRSQGVIVGGTTFRVDKPQLNLRNYQHGPLEERDDPNVYLLTQGLEASQVDILQNKSLSGRIEVIPLKENLNSTLISFLFTLGERGVHQVLIEAGPKLSRNLWSGEIFNEWVFLKGDLPYTGGNGPWGVSKWYPSPLSCGEICKFGLIENDQFLVLKNRKVLSN